MRRGGCRIASATSATSRASLFLSAVLRKQDQREGQYDRQSNQQIDAISHVEAPYLASSASIDVSSGGHYFFPVGGDRLGSIHNSNGCAGFRWKYAQRDLIARHKHLSSPTLSGQNAGTIQFSRPMHQVAGLILHIEIELGVRVLPNEFRNGAF